MIQSWTCRYLHPIRKYIFVIFKNSETTCTRTCYSFYVCVESFMEKQLFTWFVWKGQKIVIYMSYVCYKKFSFLWSKQKINFSQNFVSRRHAHVYTSRNFFPIIFTFFKNILIFFSKNGANAPCSLYPLSLCLPLPTQRDSWKSSHG